MASAADPLANGPDPMAPRPFRIARRSRETKDVFTLELESEVPMSFRPGQFNMLYAFGVGESAISISGSPEHPSRLVHTVRAVGEVTSALARLKRGDTVGIRGPFGSGWPLDEARGNDVLLVAGGIGLAPLRPALYHLLAERGRYGRVILLYGARTPGDLLYASELEQWRGRFDLEIEVTVDVGLGDWRGNVGLVTSLIPRAPFDPRQTVAFVCGPEVMMRFVVTALEDAGVAAGDVYLSMERNMKCALGFCGHCQLGPLFVCKDGPVLSQRVLAPWLRVRDF
jgi:NAD(P)H-flavin reductase